jgi:hypothetical protein
MNGSQCRSTSPSPPDSRWAVPVHPVRCVKETREAQQREIRTLAAHGAESALSEAELLAVSGGGADGAFGAGLLAGWSPSDIFKTRFLSAALWDDGLADMSPPASDRALCRPKNAGCNCRRVS